MARSNMRARADSFMGRSENEDPNKICLAVSGWLLITTGVGPRLNAIILLAFNDAAKAASLACARDPIRGREPSMGQPIGPESFAFGFSLLE